jgi:diaminohydroxyphosphoribosylaminopyrimidine deaminase/5-amino-6-(5-phosphoribosylamino)uracil reductase
MARALELARDSGVRKGPNPAVGCVLLGEDGRVLAEGFHRGAGTPHAEAAALAALWAAGGSAAGATAVVTLEPCAHHGRTPPCADALIDAGVARVVFGQTDPNPVAAGGASTLRSAGIEVTGGLMAAEAEAINEVWSAASRMGRPVVTWKVAASLDGRIAATDGTSQWITGEAAREQVHELRADVDAVLTGTGTVRSDDPRMTARLAERARPVAQPLRVVMGESEVPSTAAFRSSTEGGSLVLSTRDPSRALATLMSVDVRHVLLECGPRLASAFLRTDLVDRIVWFAAPLLLGGSALAVAQDIGVGTLTDARRWQLREVRSVGSDVRMDFSRAGASPGDRPEVW